MMDLKIAHMYPDLLNLYGDRGNLRCLQMRLAWRGYKASIEPVYLDDARALESFDMVFIGGGSDREQNIVYEDLLHKADNLWKSIDGGMPVLAICGGYQLLGQYYRALNGDEMKGLGFFDYYTQGEEGRLIGNIVINWNSPGGEFEVVGFENHGGRTYLNDPALGVFGKVVKGYGNNGKDGGEGMHFKNLVGTYLHGPLLPKNPDVADYFIETMLNRHGESLSVNLGDRLEKYAHQQARQRALG